MSKLEEILGEATEEPVEEKVEETVEESTEEPTEESTEEPEEPEGVKEEPEKEPAEPPSAKEVPLTALLDERDKRKQFQAELEQLRKQMAEKTEAPDFWADPQNTVQSMIAEQVGSLKNEFTTGYLNLSMQYSKAFHDDFDSAKEAFIKAAEENPALADAAVQSEMPGEYIYKTGKEFMALSQYGDVETALEAAKRQAVEEYIAKQAAEKEGKAKKIAAVPTPLTEESSAASPKDKVEGGATPLENIFQYNRG